MSLKEFLMPDWRKIVVFILLFIVVTYIGLSTITGIGPKSLWWSEKGIPLFYIHEGDYGPHSPGFYIVNFLIDLITYIVISYLLSCLIVWGYDKLKKKPEKKKRK